MFKKIDKVLAAFGNIKAMERLHVDTFTENKITNINGDKIAESSEGQLYVTYEELNGYLFLETIFLSHTNIKTFNGATLCFSDVQTNFTLESDTKEIGTDFSNVSNRHMTQISFNINERQIELIKNGEFKQVELRYKKKLLTLYKVS